MKLYSIHNSGSKRSGMATIAVIAIIALLLVFVMGNVRSLNALSRQLRLLDQTQRARIHMPAQGATNSVSATENATSTNKSK